MGVLVGLVVYDSVLFNTGHNVRRWANAVERRYTANAILFAPVNKRINKSDWYPDHPVGSLKANISGSVTRVGPKFLQTDITVDVPYAIFVIQGTGDIFPQSGKYLRLPFNPGFSTRTGADAWSGTRSLHTSVSGQAPNDFLSEAHDATAMRHPSIGRASDQVFKQF
jgi:hypothetical protein